MVKRIHLTEEMAKKVLPARQDATDRLTKIERPKLGRQTYSLPQDMIDDVKQMAFREGLSASDIVKLAIREYLRQYEKI